MQSHLSETNSDEKNLAHYQFMNGQNTTGGFLGESDNHHKGGKTSIETAMMVLGDTVVEPSDNEQRLITINDEHSESLVQIKHYPCDDDQIATGDAQSHRTRFYHHQNENATINNCN